MYHYETHLHTHPVSACGANSPKAMVKAYKAMGYTGFIITDHFFNGNSGCPLHLSWDEKINFFLSGYEAAKKEGEKNDFDVFLGWEYAVKGTELLTYGLGEDFLRSHPHCDRLTIEDYSDLVRKNGGYIAQAHPYREAPWVINPYPVAPHLIDGIEVYNASQPKESNQKAYGFAQLHNIAMQSGSDAHGIHTPELGGIIVNKRPDTIHDLIAAIKERKVKLICAAPAN